MRDLIASVDPGLFWGLVVGFVLGIGSAWRFARTLERFRQAIERARHYLDVSMGNLRLARQNAAAMVGVAAFALTVGAGLTYAIVTRISGG